MYSCKMVVSGQNGCIQIKWLYSGKSFFICAKVVIFGHCGCI